MMNRMVVSVMILMIESVCGWVSMLRMCCIGCLGFGVIWWGDVGVLSGKGGVVMCCYVVKWDEGGWY